MREEVLLTDIELALNGQTPIEIEEAIVNAWCHFESPVPIMVHLSKLGASDDLIDGIVKHFDQRAALQYLLVNADSFMEYGMSAGVS